MVNTQKQQMIATWGRDESIKSIIYIYLYLC